MKEREEVSMTDTTARGAVARLARALAEGENGDDRAA
jgi:hypothetical protein